MNDLKKYIRIAGRRTDLQDEYLIILNLTKNDFDVDIWYHNEPKK